MAQGREAWRLSYGWMPSPDPFRPMPAEKRPAHIKEIVFHSLEAALKYPSCGTWWEITAPDGRIVVSSHHGFDETACSHLSFCARQILNMRYLGSFPETEIEDVLDSASHDDGATWQPVLLGVKNTSQNTKNGHYPKAAPSTLSILSADQAFNDPKRVVIRHTSGQVCIRRDLLEIRQTAKGHNLTILDPESGRAKGVYALVDCLTVGVLAHLLGVRLIEKDTDRGEGKDGGQNRHLPKTWKLGLFKRAQADGPPLDTRGHIRGALAIDRRAANVKGYGDYTYQSLLWHLTHIPTGLLIVTRKHRVQVEEIADSLREEIPELTDGGEDVVVNEEMRKRAQVVIDRHKGARW